MFTIEAANVHANNLTEQAERNGLKGADGEALKFKIVTITDDKRVKARFNVVIVEMIEKTNLIGGKKFWIDRDAPRYMDPSSEAYHSM